MGGEEIEIFVLLIGYSSFLVKDYEEDPDGGCDICYEALPRNENGDPMAWRRGWCAIALEKLLYANGEEVFQRIGFVAGQDYEGNEWFDGCSRQDLKMI
jgi:hypothetical protein